MSLIPRLEPPSRTLLGPGPSPVPPQVLQSMSLPVIGHLDPAFLKIMDESMARRLRPECCSLSKK